MKFALACLLTIPAVFGLLDGALPDIPGVPDITGEMSDLAGKVAKEAATELVTKGVTEIAGEKIGKQVGEVAGELAGTLAKCYVDGVLTGGSGCANTVVKAALDKAGKQIIDDLKKDMAGEINKIAQDISKVLQGAISDVSKDIGNVIGGDLGAGVGSLVNDALTNLAGDGLKDAVNAIIKPPTGCVDKDTICPSQKNLCTDKIYSKLMSEMCCKTCTGGSTAPSAGTTGTSSGSGSSASTCKDLQSYCTANKNLCNNASYKSMMTTNCPKTCGVC